MLDIAVSKIVKESNGPAGEIQVWNDIYTNAIDVDLAIYGSSRSWVHINPEILNDTLGMRAYNFGIDGHNFWLQYLRHKEYMKHNNKPKAILLSVDVFSLTKRDDLYLSQQFLPYMLWDNTIKQYTQSYNGFNLGDYYIPFFRYYGKGDVIKTAFFDDPQIQYRKKGYRAVNKQWNTDFEKALRERKNFRTPIDSASLSLLKVFAEECKENNIALVFVYTPEYFEGQKFVKNRDTIVTILKNVANEYKIPYLDYSEDSLNFDKQYFYNASHLNKKGATLFSRQLAEDLSDVLKTHSSL